MIYDAPFLLAFSILLIPLSPLLAIMERLLIALGAIGMVFVLGIIILSSPLIFLGGVVLILASSATTATGIYFIVFSIISPLMSYLMNTLLKAATTSHMVNTSRNRSETMAPIISLLCHPNV